MGFDRQVKRNKEKEEYKRFQKAWNDEQRFQKYLIEHQGAPIIEKDGRKIVVHNDAEMPLLGRKPTFQMWRQSVENNKLAMQESHDKKKAEVTDLSWDEGG